MVRPLLIWWYYFINNFVSSATRPTLATGCQAGRPRHVLFATIFLLFGTRLVIVYRRRACLTLSVSYSLNVSI